MKFFSFLVSSLIALVLQQWITFKSLHWWCPTQSCLSFKSLWGSVCVWCDVLLWAHMLMHTYKEIISLPFLVSFTFSPKPEELEACHHLKLQEKLPIYFSLSDIWIKNNAEILMNETVSSQIKIACNISVWDFEEGISEYRNDFS